MTETQRRIRAYKRALPELRERVIAVALLLAMSASMLTSASFAWITLSRAPEARGMQTTVAANGNLEIALANAEGEEPPESKEGDSSAQQGVVKSNITWGNLVNLSDPEYGLDQIELRPALLSDYNRNRYPLYGATYGGDGRVVATSDKYEFATWSKNPVDGMPYFAAGSASTYGVRAIASVKYENVTGNALLSQFETNVNTAHDKAREIYRGLVSTDREKATKLTPEQGTALTSIEALQGLVTIFAQNKVDKKESSYSQYIWYFHQMMLILQDVLEQEGAALLTMANWQAYLYQSNNGLEARTDTFKTIDELLQASSTTLKNQGVTLTTLANYKSSVTDLQWCIDGMGPMAEACKHPDDPNLPEYKWVDIQPYVNKLVNINSTTITGGSLKDQPLGSLGVDEAMGLLGVKDAIIIVHAGVLKDTEQRVIDDGSRLDAYVTISVKYVFSVSVGGTVSTDASGDASCAVDSGHCVTLSSDGAGGSGEAVAKDTYGMAIDMWVRTNHAQSVLTLEGSTVFENIDVTGVDAEGNTVTLYSLDINGSYVEVYQKEGVWYYADGHEAVEEEALAEKSPTKKTTQIIVDYQGENRIEWQKKMDQGVVEKDSTTQGSGSCFVFYADNPAEQSKIIDLLDAFTVAFLNESGTTLGTAKLNIDNAYFNQGKVTIPLQITDGVKYTDGEGQEQLGIVALERNEPTWITAVIYLNGSDLENENVLSAGEIQGQLNIQFGSSEGLAAPPDEDLQMQYRTISATVTVGSDVSTDQEQPITLDYNADGHKAVVTLNVAGEQPSKIEGFFVRVINATQGTRGEKQTFTKNEDGTWSSEFMLTAPGTYVLNTLLVDGVQYDLHTGNHPAVAINGLSLGRVTTDVQSGTYMYVEKSLNVFVTADVSAATGLEPKQVKAQFFSEDNSKQYNAIMKYNTQTGLWEGTATIGSSGTYILKYISLDTDTLEVQPQDQTRLKLYLGLTAQVYTAATERDFMYETGFNKQFEMQVKIFDDGGKAIDNLSKNVSLYYHSDTSELDEDGMYVTNMEWNSKGYYYGTFNLDTVGTYEFNRLMVTNAGKTSTIYRAANETPVFTVYSPDPPSYESASAVGYQLAISNPAKAKVILSNAENAVVWAEFTNTSGKTMLVKHVSRTAVLGGETEFTFDLQQDGLWTLKKLYCQNVYNELTYYPAADTANDVNSYVIVPENIVTTDIVATVDYELRYDGTEKTESFTIAFGGTKNKPTGNFMDSYENKALTVKIMDYAGRAIDGVKGVSWVIKHNVNTMKDYGGYTGVGQSENEVTMVLESGSETVYKAPTQKFFIAGEYSTELTIAFEDNNKVTLPVKPAVTVASIVPTVAITDITMDGGAAYSVDLNTTGSLADSSTYRTQSGGCITDYIYTCTTHKDHIYAANNSSYISRIVDADGKTATTGLTAYLYFKCNHADVATYDGGTKNGPLGATFQGHTYAYDSGNGVPKATLTLNGMGNATGAVLEFAKTGGGDVIMITQYTADRTGGTYWGDFSTYGTSTYAWSTDGTCSRFIGVMDNGAGDNRSDTKTAAGTISASTLILIYNNVEYSVTIPTITIHNPC